MWRHNQCKVIAAPVDSTTTRVKWTGVSSQYAVTRHLPVTVQYSTAVNGNAKLRYFDRLGLGLGLLDLHRRPQLSAEYRLADSEHGYRSWLSTHIGVRRDQTQAAASKLSADYSGWLDKIDQT